MNPINPRLYIRPLHLDAEPKASTVDEIRQDSTAELYQAAAQQPSAFFFWWFRFCSHWKDKCMYADRYTNKYTKYILFIYLFMYRYDNILVDRHNKIDIYIYIYIHGRFESSFVL